MIKTNGMNFSLYKNCSPNLFLGRTGKLLACKICTCVHFTIHINTY